MSGAAGAGAITTRGAGGPGRTRAHGAASQPRTAAAIGTPRRVVRRPGSPGGESCLRAPIRVTAVMYLANVTPRMRPVPVVAKVH